MKTYNGTGNNDDRTEDIALDQDWNIIVTGFSKGNGSDYDITTVKYAEAVFAYDPGTTENFNGVSMTSTGSAFAVGNNGSIYSTESLGNDWNAQSSGTSRNLNGVHFISPFRGMAAGDSGTILFTTNAGTNWTSQFSGTIFNLRSIYIIDTNVAEAVGNSGVVLRTSNAGANWLPQVSGTLNNLKAVYFTDHNNGYAVGDAATIIHTTNGGLIWLGQSSGLSSTINFKGVFFPSAGKGRVIGTKGNVLNTSDGGTNWSSESTVAGTTDLNGIFFLNSNTGYIVGAAGFVMATTDNGAEWNTQSSDISTHLLSVSYSDENSGVAVGENGTIELTTIGEFTVNATGPLFSSIQNFGSETPLRFKLEQNFPNPFNPLTAIKFALPKDEKVTLSIYDVTGRLVTNLIDGDRKAGEQTVWFNGSSLASGIYIYSIRAGEYAFSRKMVLVK